MFSRTTDAGEAPLIWLSEGKPPGAPRRQLVAKACRAPLRLELRYEESCFLCFSRDCHRGKGRPCVGKERRGTNAGSGWRRRVAEFAALEQQGAARQGGGGQLLDLFVHQQPSRASLYEGLGRKVQGCRFGGDRRPCAGVWFRERSSEREDCCG